MMKKIFLCLSLLSLLALPSCSTMTGIGSLLTCSYNLTSVTAPQLAGIGLTSTSDLMNLNAMTALKVTTSLLSGSLPLSATVNVGVTNPNQTEAQIAGLDWMLFFQGVNMLSGRTTQAVHVAPNGGQTLVPFNVEVDLAQIFKKESKESMLQFANGLLHLGESSSQVTLKIRPSISFGGHVVNMNYITVSKSL